MYKTKQTAGKRRASGSVRFRIPHVQEYSRRRNCSWSCSVLSCSCAESWAWWTPRIPHCRCPGQRGRASSPASELTTGCWCLRFPKRKKTIEKAQFLLLFFSFFFKNSRILGVGLGSAKSVTSPPPPPPQYLKTFLILLTSSQLNSRVCV